MANSDDLATSPRPDTSGVDLESAMRRWASPPRIAAVVPRIAAVVLLVSTIVCQAAAAAPSGDAPLERQLLNDARDGRLDEISFLDGALIASGIDQPQQLVECRQRFAELCDRFRTQKRQTATTRELAVAVLEFLHREILTGNYQLATTRVDQALITGDYNCVASTILFRCLSGEFGLTPAVLATPSHVFCRYQGADRLAVETTCPDWFALPDNSETFIDHPANRGGVDVRTLSDVEVLGKLFYNRATDKLEAKEFAAACDLLRTSMVLDPGDGAARENLLAAINNWSLQQCEADEFAHAAQLLAQGAAISPDYLPIQMNDLHVHQQWALDLCQRQQFAEALALLASSHRRRPDARLFDQGRFAVYGLWADALFSQGKDAEALRLFDQAIEQYPERTDVRQYETAAILRAVQQRITRRQWIQARGLLEQGLARQPGCAQLETKVATLTK